MTSSAIQLNEKCALKSAKYLDIWFIYSGKQKCKQPDLIRWDGRRNIYWF